MNAQFTHQAGRGFLIEAPIQRLLPLRIRGGRAPGGLLLPLSTNPDPVPEVAGANERNQELTLVVGTELKLTMALVIIVGVEAAELRPSILRPSYEHMMTSIGAIAFLGWMLGEFVLSRNALMVCVARLGGQSQSRTAGPRLALPGL